MYTRLLVLAALVCAIPELYAQENNPEEAKNHLQNSSLPICAFTLNTDQFYIPLSLFPSIWATTDQPVYIRIYGLQPYFHWDVKQVADRRLAESGIEQPALQRTVRASYGQGFAVNRATLDETTRNELEARCGEGPLYYIDIVVDDAEPDRSRVYALQVETAATRAAAAWLHGDSINNQKTNITRSTEQTTAAQPPTSDGFYFNIRRYRRTFAEAATGPIVSLAKPITHERELVTQDDETFVMLRERVEHGQVGIAVGAMLRPWGYNPNEQIGWHNWKQLFGIYIATPLSGDILQSLYIGGGLGAHRITAIAGIHIYPQSVALVDVDQLYPVALYGRDVADLTYRKLDYAFFFGVQLDTSLFGTLFGGKSGNP